MSRQSNLLNTLNDTILWFERAVPEPTNKNFHTQIGCHLEEVAEMLETVHSNDYKTARMLHEAEDSLKALADWLKSAENLVTIPEHLRKDMLDSICDQIVTATGVAHMQGFDVLGAMNEVNDSNWSKFVLGQPVFDANQKIQKGPNYRKAELEPFLEHSLR